MRKEQEKQKATDQTEAKKCKQYAVVPYMKGVTKRLQRALKKYNIALYAKAGFTIKNVLYAKAGFTIKNVLYDKVYYQECHGEPQGSWRAMWGHIRMCL